jgi:hypothetical protein
MGVSHERFVRLSPTPGEAQELVRVDALATELLAHLELSSDEINRVHVHRAQSSAVQAIVSTLLR